MVALPDRALDVEMPPAAASRQLHHAQENERSTTPRGSAQTYGRRPLANSGNQEAALHATRSRSESLEPHDQKTRVGDFALARHAVTRVGACRAIFVSSDQQSAARKALQKL